MKLSKLILRKKSNSAYLIDSTRYQDLINEVKYIKYKNNKDFEEYRMLASYDILEVNGKDRLIQPKNEGNPHIRFYVAIPELFGVLHTMHLLFDHANKDVLDAEIKTKYCNVSKEVIKIYLTCCKRCNNEE